MSGRLAVCVCLLGWPVLAAAAPPALVVLPDDVAGQQRATIVRALTPGAKVMRRQAFYQAVQRLAARRALQRGRTLLAAGTEAVARLQYEQAEASLTGALRQLAAAQQLANACEVAYEAARELSFLHWTRKQLDRAVRWRAAAGQLTATRTIDPARYKPPFIAFWQEEGLPDAMTTTIAVEGLQRPTSARVWVACHERGAPPLVASVVGAALVQAVDRAVSASAVLEPTSSALVELALPRASEPPATAVRAMLTDQGAAELLWLRASEQGWIADRFDPERGWQRAVRKIGPPAPPTAAPEPAPAEPPPPESRSRVPTMSWVLGAAAAAALATGVVGVVVARRAGDAIEDKSRAHEVFDASDERTNQAGRTTAYIGFAVGGALAVAAVVIGLWQSRDAKDAPRSASAWPGALTLSW